MHSLSNGERVKVSGRKGTFLVVSIDDVSKSVNLVPVLGESGLLEDVPLEMVIPAASKAHSDAQ